MLTIRLVTLTIAVWLVLALAGTLFTSVIVTATPCIVHVWGLSAAVAAFGTLTYGIVFH